MLHDVVTLGLLWAGALVLADSPLYRISLKVIVCFGQECGAVVIFMPFIRRDNGL